MKGFARRCQGPFLTLTTFLFGIFVAWPVIPTLTKRVGNQQVQIPIGEPLVSSPRQEPPAKIPDESIYVEPDFNGLDVTKPYEIKNFINTYSTYDITPLWRKLRINGKFHGLPGWKPDGDFLSSCSDCKAEVSEFQLDDRPGKEILLRISDDMSESCRYLVFTPKRSRNRYRLVGFVDHSFGRYLMPEHRFVIGGGRSYLVIKVQTVSGSGVAMYFSRMFQMKEGKLVEILTYPSEGHQDMAISDPTNREFVGRVASLTSVHRKPAIKIDLSVRYVTWDDKRGDIELWNKNQSAVFVESKRSKYQLDPKASNITLAELKSVYDVDTLTYEDFCIYNHNEIRATFRRIGWKPTKP
jgi:hypothetical protein